MEGVPDEPRLFWYKGWSDITKGPFVEEQMLELYRTSHLASSMVVSENSGPFVTLGDLMIRRGVINPFLPDFIVGGRPRETSMSGEKVDLLAEKIDFLYLSVRRLTEELHNRAPAQIDDDVFNQPALVSAGDTNQSSEEAPSPQSADSSAISGWHDSTADTTPENFQPGSVGSSPDVWPAGLISPTALLLDRSEWDFTRAGGFASNIGPNVTPHMPIGGQMAQNASRGVDQKQSVSSSSDDWMVVGQEFKAKKRRYSERRSAHPLPLLKTCTNKEHQPADETRLAELSRTWRKVVSDKREVIYSRAVAEAFQAYLQDIECPSCPQANLKKNNINFLGHLLSRNHLKQLDSVCAPDVEFWIHFLTNRRSAEK